MGRNNPDDWPSQTQANIESMQEILRTLLRKALEDTTFEQKRLPELPAQLREKIAEFLPEKYHHIAVLDIEVWFSMVLRAWNEKGTPEILEELIAE